jgi:predicted membrane protein
MGCAFFSGFFWGTFLIVLGVVIILKVLFNINIPVFRILFAVLLIYLGIRILIGGFCCGRPGNTVSFGESNIRASDMPGNEYQVLFGKGVVDLTGVSLEQGTARKKVHTVFGSCTLRIDPAMPVTITADSAFASARFPDGNVITFGKYTYRSKNYQDTANALVIDADVVFGQLDVVVAGKQ